MALLQADEISSLTIVNFEGPSPYILVCEHASQRLPQKLGRLGLSAEDLEGHWAWDIGAAALGQAMSELLDAPLLLQNYSRLAYDCNRPPQAPDAMTELSELTPIPGNRNLSASDRLERITELYHPFHAALAHLLDDRSRQLKPSRLVSIHSFTPVYKGVTRQLECGLLFDQDDRLAKAMMPHLDQIDLRLNEPYGPRDGVLHTLNLHAAPRHLPAVMIEVRNDLIHKKAGQEKWARLLSTALLHADDEGEGE